MRCNFRREPRTRAAIRLHLRYPESEPFRHEVAVTENVSAGGLYIWTRSRIPAQSRVYLESLTGNYRAIALVVRSDPAREGMSGAGLKVLASRGDLLLSY